MLARLHFGLVEGWGFFQEFYPTTLPIVGYEPGIFASQLKRLGSELRDGQILVQFVVIIITVTTWETFSKYTKESQTLEKQHQTHYYCIKRMFPGNTTLVGFNTRIKYYFNEHFF